MVSGKLTVDEFELFMERFFNSNIEPHKKVFIISDDHYDEAKKLVGGIGDIRIIKSQPYCEVESVDIRTQL